MKKFGCKILSIVLLIICCFSMFSCGEEEQDYWTVKATVDGKEMTLEYWEWDGLEIYLEELDGSVPSLPTASISPGKHTMIFEFFTPYKGMKISDTYLCFEGENKKTSYDWDFFSTFDYENGKLVATFETTQEMSDKYEAVYFHLEITTSAGWGTLGWYYWGFELI